jgi:hypothetical protein
MTDKTLPEIYREAADLVLKVGTTTGEYAEYQDGTCAGYCTMGAVFAAAGILVPGAYDLDLPNDHINSNDPTFLRYVQPISDQLLKSGRRRLNSNWEDSPAGVVAFLNIYHWNDRRSGRPSAEDVAELLRETADSVESQEDSAK